MLAALLIKPLFRAAAAQVPGNHTDLTDALKRFHDCVCESIVDCVCESIVNCVCESIVL